jgi:hypothetical protein
MNPVVVRKDGHTRFWCPGCDDLHQVDDLLWTVTGEDALTISPSVLVVYGNHLGAKSCHSFVTDGQIRFLDDCSHALRNQTLPLPEMPDWCLGLD